MLCAGEECIFGIMGKIDFTLFRRNLATVRTCKGLTAEQLSVQAKLRIKKRCADLENDRGLPDLAEILAICKVLDVSMDDMLLKRAVATINFFSDGHKV